jgi:hypothetical protein
MITRRRALQWLELFTRNHKASHLQSVWIHTYLGVLVAESRWFLPGNILSSTNKMRSPSYNSKIVCLFIYSFTSRSRICHLYGDVTISGEELHAKFRPMLGAQGLWAGGIFIAPHLLWACDTGPQFFRSLPKDRPIQSPLTTYMGMWRIYSNPFSRLLRHTWECW